MLKMYLYKFLLALFLSVFSITSTLSSEEPEKETSATKRSSEEAVVAPDSEAEKLEETLPKKKQRVERDEAEEEREPTEEELKASETLSSPQRGTIEKSINIGTWVGNTKNGIADFQLSYNSSIFFKEIIDWHVATGNQINKIVNYFGPEDDATNYIRARIDIIYKEKSSYGCQGALIPILFLSGFSDASAQRKVLKLQEDISHITADPCISISSYYKWESLWKENYEPIRDELRPFFVKGSAQDLLSNKFLQTEEESLVHSNRHAFQFWLHSEEPILLYIMGHPAMKADGKGLSPTFREIIQGIKLPKDAIPELCILNMVSRNDCCTHCRPLLFEAMEHKDFLEKSISKGLELKTDINLVKVLLYSSLHEFQFKRPCGGYQEKLNINSRDNVLFLMAGNVPNREE